MFSPQRYGDDESKTETVGVKRSSGAVVWRNKGSDNDCGAHSGTSPVLTTVEALSTGPDTSSSAPVAAAFFRCRFTGVWKGNAFDSTLVGGAVVVERFDPSSGRTLWKLDLGRGPGLLAGGEDVTGWSTSVVDDAHLAFGTGKDHLVVDVRTGKASPAERDQPAWCWDTLDKPYKLALKDDFVVGNIVRSDPLLVRCTPDGKASKAVVDRVPSARRSRVA
jgi:hypothetical protein